MSGISSGKAIDFFWLRYRFPDPTAVVGRSFSPQTERSAANLERLITEIKAREEKDYGGLMPLDFLNIRHSGKKIRVANCAGCELSGTRLGEIVSQAQQAHEESRSLTAPWEIIGGFDRGIVHRVPVLCFNDMFVGVDAMANEIFIDLAVLICAADPKYGALMGAMEIEYQGGNWRFVPRKR